MEKLQTIIGRVTHVGPSTRDAHSHVYSLIEITTANGRIGLKNVAAENELVRAIVPSKAVRLCVLPAADGAAKSVLLAAYDESEDRLLFNEEMFELRQHAVNQAFLFSFLGIFLIPIGLAFFVVPGLLYIRALWKAWSSIGLFPTPEELRARVEALKPVLAKPA